MLQDIYYSRRSNKAVQVITQCRMLPDGTEAVCFQEMSGDYEVFVLAKEHFVRIFQKMDVNVKEDIFTPEKLMNEPEKTVTEEELMSESEESVKEIVGSNASIGDNLSPHREGDLFTPEEIVTEEEEEVPGIIQFLDAETYEEKMKVLESMRDDLDERTLNNMAVSLDLTINSGVDAYSFLMSELRIRSRYEGKRGQRL